MGGFGSGRQGGKSVAGAVIQLAMDTQRRTCSEHQYPYRRRPGDVGLSGAGSRQRMADHELPGAPGLDKLQLRRAACLVAGCGLPAYINPDQAPSSKS